jgi:hypothetical protein
MKNHRTKTVLLAGLGALALCLSVVLIASAGPTREDGEPSFPETASLVAYFHEIRLTPEQEDLKSRVLASLPAPCCSKFSMATCCCPCNLAKAVWGLSKHLIADKGYGEEELRKAVQDWIRSANASGFSGEACFEGRCERPLHEDGCGGMRESAIR